MIHRWFPLIMFIVASILTTNDLSATNLKRPFSGSATAPAIDATPTITSTPSVALPLTAPKSAPSDAFAPGITPTVKASERAPSHWRSSLAVGGVLPQSAAFQSNYFLGFTASLGTGYQFSKIFSEWLMLDFDHFTPRGTSSTQYNVVGLAFWSKFTPLDGPVSPLFFAGPGLSYNEIRSNTASGYDYYTGQFYFPVNAYEVDLVTEAGFGVQWQIADTFRLFILGKVTMDFLSQSFSKNALSDSPSLAIPIQVGTELGL